MPSYNQRSETITFLAAETTKTSSLPFADYGLPFTHLKLVKSGGATAMTVVIGVGSTGGVWIKVTEAGAETLLVTALLDGVVETSAAGLCVRVAAGTFLATAALVDGTYFLVVN